MRKGLLLTIFLSYLSFPYFAQNQTSHLWILKDLFRELQKQYGYRFMYSNNDIDDKKRINININHLSLNNILDELSKQNNLSYKVINKQIIIKKKSTNIKTEIQVEKQIPPKEQNPIIPKENIFAILNSDPLLAPEKKSESVTKSNIIEAGPGIINNTDKTTDEILNIPSKEKEISFSTPESELKTIIQNSEISNYKSPSQKESNWKFSLHNNLLYDLILIPNIGIECSFKNKYSIILNGTWNHFNWKNGEKTYRTWSVNPEVRYYFSRDNKFYTGALFQIGQINLKLNATGNQGDFISGAVTIGYILNLNKNFHLDFGLGFGYLYYSYETYNYLDGVNIRNEKGTKNLFIPVKAGINIVWKLN